MYSPHPENPSHTLLRQEAVVLVQGVPLSSYMESVLTNSISSNATKVLVAIMYYLISRFFSSEAAVNVNQSTFQYICF